MSVSASAIPLFPLQTVLFPDGRLHLQIFEPRYLSMVRQCHEHGSGFGVVSLLQGAEVQRAGPAWTQEVFQRVGTLARIMELDRPQPALYDIQVRGETRFRIERCEQLPSGLWMADVHPLPDDLPVSVPLELSYIVDRLERILDTLQRVSPLGQGQLAPFQPYKYNLCSWVANRWCELLPISTQVKQQLMEIDNGLLRLELVGDLLDDGPPLGS